MDLYFLHDLSSSILWHVNVQIFKEAGWIWSRGYEQLSTACVESANLSIRLVESQIFGGAHPARRQTTIYYVFIAGVMIVLKVF